MKPPRIVQITDPYERQLLLKDQGKEGIPDLFENKRDGTFWAEESRLYQWRKNRVQP